MASQYGDTREYTSTDEATSPQLKQCPSCKTKGVPRGITSTMKAGVVSGPVSCPYCGHIYGNDSLIDTRVEGVAIKNGANVVTTATMAVSSTLQLTAEVAPFYASDQTVAWSSSNTAVATVSATGLVTSTATAGSAVITATSNADNTKSASVTITT